MATITGPTATVVGGAISTVAASIKYPEPSSVIVHEGGLPLMPGETVSDFRDAMESALSAFWSSRGIQDTDETGWFFQREIFADAVIVRIRPASGPSTMVRQAFVRDANGVLQIGDPVEVRQTTSFVPVGAPQAEQSELAAEALRRGLPPQAYAIPFFANEARRFKRDGTIAEFRRRLSALPHHVHTVRRASEDVTVDLRLLRNSLARTAKLDDRRFPAAAVREGVSHVAAHADAILRSQRRGEAEALQIEIAGHWYEVVGGQAALDLLQLDRDDLLAGRFPEVRARQIAEGIWTLARTLSA